MIACLCQAMPSHMGITWHGIPCAVALQRDRVAGLTMAKASQRRLPCQPVFSRQPDSAEVTPAACVIGVPSAGGDVDGHAADGSTAISRSRRPWFHRRDGRAQLPSSTATSSASTATAISRWYVEARSRPAGVCTREIGSDTPRGHAGSRASMRLACATRPGRRSRRGVCSAASGSKKMPRKEPWY
jgi:hypothetical protein